jgi:hypothetical protein
MGNKDSCKTLPLTSIHKVLHGTSYSLVSEVKLQLQERSLNRCGPVHKTAVLTEAFMNPKLMMIRAGQKLKERTTTL